MNKRTNFFILITSLLIKWIIWVPVTAAAQNNPVSSNLDPQAQRIIALIKQQQKEKILDVIEKVDSAIDKIINIPDNERKRFAVLISLACKKYNLDPRIVIAILKTESDFKQHAISHTGDYSVAQINFKVWSRSFNKMNRAPLKFEKLREDEAYSIFRMAEILSILQKQHSKTDKDWFAIYHSATPKFKSVYLAKLERIIKKLQPYGDNMLEGLPDNPKIVAEVCLGEKHKIKGF